MYKVILTVLSVISFSLFSYGESVMSLKSPNEKIIVDVTLGDRISYNISCDGQCLLKDNTMQLSMRDNVLGLNPKLKKVRRGETDEIIEPTVPLKFSAVRNRYNEMTLRFNGYSVEFRAFDDGIAYRFVTEGKKDVEILDEEFSIGFPDNYLLHLQQPGGFRTAYEEAYSHIDSENWTSEDKMATLPILIDTRNEYKILVSESDLSDYPCMFLKGTGENRVTSTFPKAPLEFTESGDRSVRITKEADYIAKTQGERNYPWRYFVIAKEDKTILENTMTLKLADKNRIEDTSWINPGQVSWEWWNGACPYGPDVNFVSGYNQETYKYYIDFASKFGIPYIIMDEGWAETTRNPFIPNQSINLPELIQYGRERNVGIVLWLTWLTVENNFDLFKTFKDWGIKGVKIDFMDRSDQWMVNYYERVAKEAAKNCLFVDFHGSFKPAGLEYKYPNILSYEGVRGMEQMGGCRPENSLYLPFMRNAVGPMDYTPGAMLSMQPEAYRAERPNSASIGTRAYQMALFVIFESGLQMLADNPTLYYRNEDCTEFITTVPVTWDETIALDAKVGEYVVVAKRKGDRWFIGAITNGAERNREFVISMDFLEKNRTYKMTSFEDGINAGRQAMDYRKKTSAITSQSSLTIRLVRNGGFAAVIE